MKNIILTFFFLTIIMGLKAQLFQLDQGGMNFYEQGTDLLRNGDYSGADSLLSLALCSYQNENVYFNRAISRLLLKDTLYACEDFLVAAKIFFDTQAEEFYNLNCCTKVDTFYFDRKKQAVDKSIKYRYYEIIKYPKYHTDIWGSYHDIKSKTLVLTTNIGCENNIMGFHNKYSDIIAGYVIKWNKKFYYRSIEPAIIYDQIGYNKTKKDAKNFLNTKYPDLLKKSDGSLKKISLHIFFNKDGHAVNIEILDTSLYNNFKKVENDLKFDLFKIINKYPEIKSPNFFKEPVDFVLKEVIELE